MSGPAKKTTGNGPLEITITGGTVLQWPVMGNIIHPYGADVNGRPNDGIDIEVDAGAPVHASGGGRVVYAGPSEQYGNLVIIAHNDMNHAAYGYLDSIDVAKGDIIDRDQVIGTAGTPEGGDTPTLHFEMRLGEDHATIDPVEVLGDMPIMTASIPAPETQSYTVKSGDNLWNIAKEQYGFSNDKADYPAIQNAMDHIASLNPFLAEGVRANHIKIGEKFALPDFSALASEPAIKLDHAALDRDMHGTNLIRGNFNKIDGGNPIVVPSAAPTDTTTDFVIGKGGGLSKTIFNAALEDGIPLSQKELRLTEDAIAARHGIGDKHIVQEGQKLHFSSNDYVRSPA